VYNGVRISDTAFVNVRSVADPPVFRHLQLQVAAGDSTKFALGNSGSTPFLYGSRGYSGQKTVQIGAQDSSGQQISGSLVKVWTSDSLNAEADLKPSIITTKSTTQIRGNRMGMATVYTSATVYGITMEDSLHLEITTPLWLAYTLKKTIMAAGGTPVLTLLPERPNEAVIGVGGWVWWSNTDQDPADSLDVVFDDPTAASPDLAFPLLASGGGNIAPFPGSDGSSFLTIRSRQFLHAGTFHWHSARLGVSGTITVK
jgi:hypothetical protein